MSSKNTGSGTLSWKIEKEKKQKQTEEVNNGY